MRFPLRLFLLALLGAATQCDASLDPGMCHTGNGNVCPWCGESCRYGRDLDPNNFGPCAIGELPGLDGPASSSSSEGADDGSDSSGEDQDDELITGE
ncbi:hypothetical protein [Nannocystis punicea]|uniref:Secreted protein n=1 Tax=Nannocystis punicea TaxID=2995304 RepID=A0ABY7GY75_9BACT|nr:hypothetical protein [Nannocystis poenicansa]WAS91877.1 hypothetical protein O0S08_37320 [Nannocystis poenicansa]